MNLILTNFGIHKFKPAPQGRMELGEGKGAMVPVNFGKPS